MPSPGGITERPTHLYYQRWACWDGCPPREDGYGILAGHDCYEIVACPITRITAKRIYFRDGGPGKWRGEQEWFVDRAAIEGNGDGVYHRRMRETLELQPPELRRYRRRSKSVAELRREMADCHPDRGGDPAEFRAARARYAAAKAVTADV